MGTFKMKIAGFTGEIIDCDEGVLKWIPKRDVPSLPLWEGDKVFLRLLMQDAPFFRLRLEYHGEALARAMLNGEESSTAIRGSFRPAHSALQDASQVHVAQITSFSSPRCRRHSSNTACWLRDAEGGSWIISRGKLQPYAFSRRTEIWCLAASASLQARCMSVPPASLRIFRRCIHRLLPSKPRPLFITFDSSTKQMPESANAAA